MCHDEKYIYHLKAGDLATAMVWLVKERSVRMKLLSDQNRLHHERRSVNLGVPWIEDG